MALGDAYITIHADVSKFRAELAAALKAQLAAAEKQRAAAAKGGSAAQTAEAKNLAKAQAAINRAAVKRFGQELDSRLKLSKAAAAEETRIQSVAAKAQDAIFKQKVKRFGEELGARLKAAKAAAAEEATLAKAAVKASAAAEAAAEKSRVAQEKAAANARRFTREQVAAGKLLSKGIEDQARRTRLFTADQVHQGELFSRNIKGTIKAINDRAAAEATAGRKALADRTRLSAQQDRDAAREIARVKAVAAARVAAERAAGAEQRRSRNLVNQIQGAARGAGAPGSTRTERVERVRTIITEEGGKGVLATLAAIRQEAAKIGKQTGIGQLISVGIGAATTALGAMATAFKFATIGAIGLGAALAFVGLESADKIQAAKIGFEGLSAEILDTTPAIDKLTKELDQISFDESAAAAKGFVEQLQAIARESAISQNTLFSTSQQLLSLGYNGQQTKDIILSLGGALASSGKSGGELNDNLRGVVTAFSQIQGAGRLLAQDLNQITTRIPALTRSKFLAQYIEDTTKAVRGTDDFNKKLATAQAEFRKGNLNINSDQAIKALLTVATELDRTSARAAALRETFKTQFAQISASATLTAQDLNSILDNKAIGKNLDDKVFVELAKSIDLVGDRTKKLTADQKAAVKEAIASGKITGKAAAEAIAEGIGANQSALKRINEETFGGAFEALKDTIRQQLGEAFADPKVAQPILDVLAKLGDEIGPIIDSLAPKLGAFSASLFGALADTLPAIATAVGQVFDVLGTALDAIGPKLPAIIAGFGQLFEIINEVANSDAAKELFNALGEAIPQIVDALAAAGPGFAVVADAAASLTGIVLELAPALKGVGDVLGAIGIILAPIALLLRAIKEAIDFLPPGLLEALGALVAILGTFVAVVTAVSLVGPAVAGALAAITVGVEALTIALLANPIGLTIAAVVALGIALVILAKKFEPVRVALTTGLELIARGFTFQINLILLAIEGLFRAFDKVGGFLGKVIPGLGGLADKAGGAADSIGHLRDEMNSAVGSISELGAKSKSAGSTIQAAASSVDAFNRAAQGTGQAALNAGASVDQLNAAIAALPLEKRISILVQIGVDNTNFLKSKNIPLTGLEDATGFSTDGINAAAAAAKESALKITDGFINSLPGGSGGSGSSGGGGTGKSSKDAKRAREQIQGIFDALKDGIKKAETKADVREAIKKLRDALKEALDIKNLPDKLADRLQRQNKRLQKLVERRTAIIKRLELAKDAFDKAISDVASFASITDAVDELNQSLEGTADKMADLSRLRIIRPGQDAQNILGISPTAVTAAQSTADRLDAILKDRLKAIQDFQADLNAIIKRGVNRNLIQQIVDAGVSGGAATADALANASNETIASINATQKQIDAAAKALGSTAGDVAASVGENVVLGIVKGLKDQKAALTVAITDLVAVIIKQLRKGLGIKSPSTVTGWVGKMTGKGLINNLRASIPAIEAAAGAMAKAATPSVLSIPSLDALQQAADSQSRRTLAVQLQGPNADGTERRHRELVGAVRDGHVKPETTRRFTPTPPPVFTPSAPSLPARAGTSIRGLR